MRRTKRWSWADLLLSTLLIAGVAGFGRTAAAQDERSGTPWLGVMTQSLTDELKESMDIDGSGVLVARVVDGSPADRAGIQRGDVISTVNSRSVTSADDLSRIVRNGRVGQEVSIQVVRDGRSRTLTATLESRPSGSDSNRRIVIRDRDRDRDEWRDKDNDNDNDNDGDRDNDNDSEQDKSKNKDNDDEGTFNFRMPNLDHLPMMGRGRLGVRVEDLDSGDRRSGTSRGARVQDVVDGSAAEKAGLREGDVITRVDGQNIDDASDLVRTLRAADRHVRITYVRGGTTRTAEADLDDLQGPQVYRYRMDRDAKEKDGERRFTIHRDRDRDLDQMDADQLRREVQELRRQVDELRKQLDERERR